MGQAKRRGTYEQRRQSAIAKANPDMGPSRLNEEYKRKKPNTHVGMTGGRRINFAMMAGLVFAATVGPERTLKYD